MGNNKDIDVRRFQYFAFLSFSSKDLRWGRRLQRKLEHYRLPAALCSERGWSRRPMRPTFFAPTDIQPGDLSEELKSRLKASRNLIVICSPNSAQSEWVGKEIAYFHSLGRDKDIYFFIVDGIPGSGDKHTECFNPIVKKLGLPEILGANIHEKIYHWPWLNRQRAYVQLISKLLGVEYDSIWKRHKRRMVTHAVAWTLGGLAVASAITVAFAAGRPFESRVIFDEYKPNSYLAPPRNIVVTMFLDNEHKTDTVQSVYKNGEFRNIPRRYFGKQVRLTAQAEDFLPVDTTVTLTETIRLNLYRNPTVYGDVSFQLWNSTLGEPLCHTKVKVGDNETVSDSDGNVRLQVPDSAQRKKYAVEVPAISLVDTIYMPSTESCIIECGK